MKNIENGHFLHTLLSALSCVLLMAVARGIICSLDSLVFISQVLSCLFSVHCRLSQTDCPGTTMIHKEIDKLVAL